jgi:hypothetical protein
VKRLLLAGAVLASACSPDAPAAYVGGPQESGGVAPMPTTTAPPDTTTTVPELVPSTIAIPVDPELNPPEPVATTPTTATTLAVRRTPPTTVVYVAPPSAVVDAGTGACGGSLPPCWVLRRESGGNIRAVNATGCGGRGCFGKWQFDPRTSKGLGYALTMDQYSEGVQDTAARTLWAGGSGCSHWAAC